MKLKKALILAGLVSMPAISTAWAADDAERAAWKAEMDALKTRLAELETKIDKNEAEKTQSKATGMPGIGEILDASGIQVHGYIDVSYSNLSSSGRFLGGVINSRVNDFEPDEFNLQGLNLTVSRTPEEGFGGVLDLLVGNDADVYAAFDTDGVYNGEKDNFDITQAYVQYATGPVTVIAGKFNTLAGYEVIKSTSNTNFSRSILIGYAEPFTHTGVRASYKFNDMVTLYAGVNNGWDLVKDTNNSKTAEAGLLVTPWERFSLMLAGYYGTERVGGFVTAGTKGDRSLITAVGTYNATDNLQFVLAYDNGEQENATLLNGSTGDADWDGWGGYIIYKFNDQWRVSLRGEYFDDEDGYRTVVEPGATDGQEWKEATFTLAYMPTEHIELRAEARRDWSDQNVFLDSNGISAEDDQDSFALQALFKF